MISPQVVGETFRTLTSHSCSTGPIAADVFRPHMDRVLANPSVQVFSPGRAAIDFALAAAVDLNVSSARIYDLILYGAMREHGVTKLATYSVKHFTGLDGIELVPLQ